MATSNPPCEIPTDDRALAWTVWPARDRPGIAALVIVVVLLVAVFAEKLMQSPWAGLLAGLFLAHALRGFFFPTIYRVDSSGVSTHCLFHVVHYPWRRIRRFRHDAHGAFLSTRARPGFLDRFSGLHLTWNANRDEAVRMIDDFQGRSTDSSRTNSREAVACGTG